MVQVQRCVWLPLVVLAVLALAATTEPKFYSDDPIWSLPRPIPVTKANKRRLNDLYDLAKNTFTTPGNDPRVKRVPALNINTLGEVPDNDWFRNRHGLHRLTPDLLAIGPGNGHAPAAGTWFILGAKAEGITPGFSMRDANGNKFLVKLDPRTNPEMATTADVIGSKFFHALGYNVPKNYIVTFDRKQLEVDPTAEFVDHRGQRRQMRSKDIDDILENAPRNDQRMYRAVASYYIPGEIIGPFRYYGLRRDDPNDFIPHEHRRELRGLAVFSAWLAHNDVKSLNTLDSIVETDGVPVIRHYLIDFGAAFGSDSFEAKSPRAGNEYFFAWKPAAAQFFSLGLYIPEWFHTNFPDMPSVGRFESKLFDPGRWVPNYPNAAFENRLPGDEYWAARHVMRFTNEDIGAIVAAGQYTEPRATEYMTQTIIERRDKIGRYYFNRVLPLDAFGIQGDALNFQHLGVAYHFTEPRPLQIVWSEFDNTTRTRKSLSGAAAPSAQEQAQQRRGLFRRRPQVRPNAPTIIGERVNLTAEGAGATRIPSGWSGYVVADIRGENPAQTVAVFLRNKDGKLEVVGIDRTW